MKDFWAFIGGVAVGILAVTGVYALEEDTPRSVEHDEDNADELENEEADDDDRLIVRAS